MARYVMDRNQKPLIALNHLPISVFSVPTERIGFSITSTRQLLGKFHFAAAAVRGRKSCAAQRISSSQVLPADLGRVCGLAAMRLNKHDALRMNCFDSGAPQQALVACLLQRMSAALFVHLAQQIFKLGFLFLRQHLADTFAAGHAHTFVLRV